jgi:hypothetical protein
LKIAYLILAHNNYEHLGRLVHALDDGKSTFYIHIDKKSSFPLLQAENVTFIKERLNVHWSGFSMVRATLNLLRRAGKDENDYFVLISGGDYPIKPMTWLRERLEKNSEYITTRKGCDQYNPLSRYTFYYFTDYYDRRDKSKLKTRFFLSFQKLLRNLKVKKTIPFQLYTGSQWFALSRQCVKYILDQVKTDKRYMRFFKTAFCPDECFFQTIIGNSDFIHKAKDDLTYADWSVDPGPAIISKKHLNALREADDKFFARKFTDDSVDVIEEIERIRTRFSDRQKIIIT